MKGGEGGGEVAEGVRVVVKFEGSEGGREVIQGVRVVCCKWAREGEGGEGEGKIVEAMSVLETAKMKGG